MSNSAIGRTKHGEMTIDQLADIQPGMGELMDEVAKRYYYTYYAAKGGNWQLALHELNQVKAVFRIARITRPKYTEDLTSFEKGYLEPIVEAIRDRSWEKFESSYQRGIEGSDMYHDKHGKSHIRFTLPEKPPEHLYLGPPEKFRRIKE